MFRFSQEFLEKTIRVWQPFSSSVLSEEDAREIAENIMGVFSLLSEWEKKDGEKSENNKEKE